MGVLPLSAGTPTKEAGRTKVHQFRPRPLPFTNMFSSLFSKVFAEEQPAEDKEPAKAEEVTEEKTEGAPAEAEEEAEEPEDVSCPIRPASLEIAEKHGVIINLFIRPF